MRKFQLQKIDYIIAAIAVEIFVLQVLVAVYCAFCLWIQFSVYAAILVITSTLAARFYRRETSRISTDPETGFADRTVFDIEQIPPDLHYLLYIRFPNLEDISLRYGAVVTLEITDILARFIELGFGSSKLSSYRIFRYGDTSLIMLLSDAVDIEIVENEAKSVLYDISQHQIPFPAYSFSFQAMLQLGIVPMTAINTEKRHRYVEYAKFALRNADPSSPTVRIFDANQYDAYHRILHRQGQVPSVIYDEQASAVFQPILDCSCGELYGYEALSRPANEEFKHIGELLQDAEDLSMYVQLEAFLTHKAALTYRILTYTLPNPPKLFLNMAPNAIRAKVYDRAIHAGLFDKIPIVLEIVERGEVLPEVVRMLRETTHCIKAQIALDDFGTGYSNHLALLNARPDIIKVSRELLTNIDTDIEKQEVYVNIVTFARNLHTKVLAEGVETETEFRTLQRLGMDYAQGWFVGKPDAKLLPPLDLAVQLCREYESGCDDDQNP